MQLGKQEEEASPYPTPNPTPPHTKMKSMKKYRTEREDKCNESGFEYDTQTTRAELLTNLG